MTLDITAATKQKPSRRQ